MTLVPQIIESWLGREPTISFLVTPRGSSTPADPGALSVTATPRSGSPLVYTWTSGGSSDPALVRNGAGDFIVTFDTDVLYSGSGREEVVLIELKTTGANKDDVPLQLHIYPTH